MFEFSRQICLFQIEESLASIKQGIHFDMHGQAHGQNSTEFGYTLPIEMLEAASHNGAEIKSSSSIDFLVNRSGLSLKSLVMGEQSLGTFLDNEGFDGLPSKNRPLPNQNTTYKYYRVRNLIFSLCLKITQQVSFYNFASEASSYCQMSLRSPKRALK